MSSDEVPAVWRDPSGWRPTKLQMSVRPDAVGIPWEKWIFQQPLCTPEQVRVWLNLLEEQKRKKSEKKK